MLSAVYATAVLLASAVTAVPVQSASKAQSSPPCRFVKNYSQDDILKDPTTFISDYLYWENKFHQNNVSYNTANGMSYDGTQVDFTTGVATKKHPFSAASKEAIQMMIYAQVIAGSPDAARWINPDQPQKAVSDVMDILQLKLNSYLKFNQTFPGFGGMLPWFWSDNVNLQPTSDWQNRIPALDNGELLWAVYGAVQALGSHNDKASRDLAQGWQGWLDYAKMNAPKLFLLSNGSVCAVTKMKDQTMPVSAAQNYSCENPNFLDDPYEGELFTWWLYFFGGLSQQQKDQLWAVKRAKLVSVEYHQGGVGPITVQEGFWFSSHEQWKVLEMPYLDVDIFRRIFNNGERARTCNSVVTNNPGMFASVNNVTDPASDELQPYISAGGIPSIASQKDQYLKVITPYSVFPTLLADKNTGLAWLRNMLLGKKMQNPYGTTESTRIDGTGVSALLTWDSKAITASALFGGVQDLVRQGLKQDGMYDEFTSLVNREYSRVFTKINGEGVAYCLPQASVGDGGLKDFTQCM